ncbi:MAG: hypothetical protein ACE5E6_03075 [Phycisphaerae bacterium]
MARLRGPDALDPLTGRYVWCVHPAREHAPRTVFALAAIVMFGGLVYLLMESAAWAAASAATIVLSLNRFFFHTMFHIDDAGVTARYPLTTRRLLWRDVRRIDYHARGARVSPVAGRSRRSRDRALIIEFGRHADQVRARLERRVGGGGAVERER